MKERIFEKKSLFGKETMKKELHSTSGFTLVELAITMVVIAIAIAIMVPVTLNMMPNYRLKKAARELMSNMQRTKLNAIKEGRFWQVSFNTAGNTYIIRDPGVDNIPGTADDPTTTVNFENYGSGVSYGFGNATGTWSGAVPGQRTTVTFSPRGTCGAGSTYITNQNNTVCFEISTNPACNIKLRKYNGMAPFEKKHWMN